MGRSTKTHKNTIVLVLCEKQNINYNNNIFKTIPFCLSQERTPKSLELKKGRLHVLLNILM